MIIKQLTVFLQNQPGRLEDLTQTLSDLHVNISALSLAEAEDYGIVRMVVSDPEKAEEQLKAANFSVKTTEVIGIEMPDVPGTLHDILKLWSSSGINVVYMYGYSDSGVARLIIKVNELKKAMTLLEKDGIK
jgi:hypothetical protein